VIKREAKSILVKVDTRLAAALAEGLARENDRLADGRSKMKQAEFIRLALWEKIYRGRSNDKK